LRSRARGRLRSWQGPDKIDDGEDGHPDDVEGVPEDAEAEEPAEDVRSVETLGPNLRHHGSDPQQPGGDVRAMAADQGEEGGKEGASLRARADRDHMREFKKLDAEKDEAQQAGHEQPDLSPQHVAALG